MWSGRESLSWSSRFRDGNSNQRQRLNRHEGLGFHSGDIQTGTSELVASTISLVAFSGSLLNEAQQRACDP